MFVIKSHRNEQNKMVVKMATTTALALATVQPHADLDI